MNCNICKKPTELDSLEVIMKMTTVPRHEEGNGETTEFHICSNCFEGEIIPFLDMLGASPTVTEFTW